MIIKLKSKSLIVIIDSHYIKKFNFSQFRKILKYFLKIKNFSFKKLFKTNKIVRWSLIEKIKKSCKSFLIDL